MAAGQHAVALLSIVNYDGSSPSIDSTYFPYTQPSFYWTSDGYQPYAGYAWIVWFYNGASQSYSQNQPNYVRLVRSGQ